ncbi:glucose major facilitator superfamily transporter [Mitosporidium daphniae]|uniref:Glucose major facilitator superfamily transporter n=1 Tax=Mitosporidium daphniae TaxID=1485682 RepID=A0A098VSM4_9MICR|nr:glucose major facilitator superfamily transporter [Mitosporidium daphniae]KGG51789.1 glucose major facilitator superfamily transporter [Mitosporidium daphniae]|eukprot:XP_013238225.1 glucose major facilitator superfamily transporter [Mitosporidium daphniae]
MNLSSLKHLFALLLLTSLTFTSNSFNSSGAGSVLRLTGACILVALSSFHVIPIFPQEFEQAENLDKLEVAYKKYPSADAMTSGASYDQAIAISPGPNTRVLMNESATHKNLGIQSSSDVIKSDKDNASASNITPPTGNVEFKISTSDITEMPSKKPSSSNMSADMNLDKSKWYYNFEFRSEIERSFAFYGFYFGGILGSVVTIFTSYYSTQENLGASATFLFFGGLISCASIYGTFLGIGRLFLGIGSGIAGTMVPIFISDSLLILDYKFIAESFTTIYPLILSGSGLFNGFLQQYWLHSYSLAWRILNCGTALLALIAFFLVFIPFFEQDFFPGKYVLYRQDLSPGNYFLSEKDSPPGEDSQPGQDSPPGEDSQPGQDLFPEENLLLKDKNISKKILIIKKTFKENIVSIFCSVIKEGRKSFLIIIFLHILQKFSLINRYFCYKGEISYSPWDISFLVELAPLLGAFLNVAINALKNLDGTSNNFIVNVANRVDMKYIGVVSGAGCTISSFLLFISLWTNIEPIKVTASFSFIFFFHSGLNLSLG